MKGLKVKRGKQQGIICSYSPIKGENPNTHGCVSVRWASGVREAWFDARGTDGTAEKKNHIKIIVN